MAQNLTFEKAIKLLKSHSASAMRYANIAALMALEHFGESGNCTKLTTVYESLPKNFVRRDAFIKWAVTFTNVKWEDRKFLKDKDREDFCNLDGARDKPFWEFSPAVEIVNFTADDLLGKVVQLIRKHENAEKMKPADATAQRTLEVLKAAVSNIKPVAPSVENKAAAAA